MDIHALESQRQVVHKSSLKFTWIAVGLILLTILMIIIAVSIGNQGVLNIVLLVLGGISFVVSMIMFGISSSKKNAFSIKFKNTFITSVLADHYENGLYNPNGGLHIHEMMIPHLFSSPDRYFTNDYLCGTYDKVHFQMCDITLQDRRTDSKGRVTYNTYLKGTYIIFDFEQDFNQVLKILESSSIFATSGLEKVQLESLAFNEKFKTLCSDQHTAFYILTPQLQEKMLEIEQKFRGHLNMAFMQGKLYMSIAHGSDLFNMKVTKPIPGEQLDKLLAELCLPKDVIKTLNINSNKKFTKQL